MKKINARKSKSAGFSPVTVDVGDTSGSLNTQDTPRKSGGGPRRAHSRDETVSTSEQSDGRRSSRSKTGATGKKAVAFGDEEESPMPLDGEHALDADEADEQLDEDLAEPEILPDPSDELAPDEDFAALDLDPLLAPHVVIDLSPEGATLPIPAPVRLPSLHTKDNLQLYLREVSRFPLLAPDEEVDLARRVRDAGDTDAAFRIISSHLRLVVKIAMDFQRRWMQNVLDLIQEGNVGLMRAVNKFDPDKGIKFSYYATFWIKAYILKFIMDNWRMVKIGTTQSQRKLFYNLNKERQKLMAQGFDPDAAALSERLGVTEDQVMEMQQRLDAGDVSLDIPVGDENGSASRMDFLPALGPGIEASYAKSEIAELVRGGIRELMPSLSEKEAYILEHRLLTDDPVTLREIGERYNVTRERIRQLEARLLTKLRTHLGSEIKDFSEEWIHP